MCIFCSFMNTGDESVGSLTPGMLIAVHTENIKQTPWIAKILNSDAEETLKIV